MGTIIHAFPGAGGGSGGHTILDPESTEMTQRPNLQFMDAGVNDDSINEVTKIENIQTIEDETDLADAPDGIYVKTVAEQEIINAGDVSFDNTDSGLQATNTQDAIDEVVGSLGTAASKDVPASGDASTTQVVMGNDTRLTDARTPVSHTHATSDISGLGTAAVVDTTNSISQGGTGVPTAGAVWTAIDNLPEPMILKGTLGTGGTITSLPTAAADNEGFTYKVITAGTYAGQAAKVGDFFVSCKPVGASAYEWVWFPSGDESFTDTWRSIKINGTEQLGTAISTGAVDFVDGTNTTVGFNASGNKISVSVPAVSSTSAGVAPKGAAVSSQSQTTKFLREDGTWAAPSYTTNTDTTYTVTTGDANGQIKVTPSSGSAYNVAVKGLGSAAYATKGTGVLEVSQSSSRSTTSAGGWTAMCNSTQTGSPKLPSTGEWWNVLSFDNWASMPNNWVSQLSIPTQQQAGQNRDTVWFKHNDAGGTSIDSSTWHSLVSGNIVGSARYGTTGSTTKIKININAETSWMLSFVVTLYQGYVGRKFLISGYNYAGNHWHSPQARLISSTDNTTANVYFGYDANYKLWVGFDGGSYTGVSVSDVCNGYTQVADYNNLFTITNVSSLATLQTTITAVKPDAATVNGLTLSLVT